MNRSLAFIIPLIVSLIFIGCGDIAARFARGTKTDSSIGTPPPSGIFNRVDTLAGDPTGVIGSSDGIGSAAHFQNIYGVATDGSNVYAADTANATIRKIVIATGEVTTFAGSAGNLGSNDGVGAAARFSNPQGIASDGTYIYVADAGNNLIRKIEISSRTVTTLAGSGTMGSSDGIGAAAEFGSPAGVAIAGSFLYVTDLNNETIRRIEIATGTVSTFAGTALHPGTNDGVGPAAGFLMPFGITSDGTSLYVADVLGKTIRRIDIATATVTTFAGDYTSPGSNDGVGVAAQFQSPFGVTTDGTNLYVTDVGNTNIRKIEISSATVSTLFRAQSSPDTADGPLDTANLTTPVAIIYNLGRLFFTQATCVRQIH